MKPHVIRHTFQRPIRMIHLLCDREEVDFMTLPRLTGIPMSRLLALARGEESPNCMERDRLAVELGFSPSHIMGDFATGRAVRKQSTLPDLRRSAPSCDVLFFDSVPTDEVCIYCGAEANVLCDGPGAGLRVTCDSSMCACCANWSQDGKDRHYCDGCKPEHVATLEAEIARLKARLESTNA